MQVCLGAGIGIARPQTVAWLSSDLFTYLLGFLMLSMGLTLTFDDFKKVRQDSPAAVHVWRSAASCMFTGLLRHRVEPTAHG